MKKHTGIVAVALLLSSCFQKGDKQMVNIYSHRHYDIDREIYREFEKETGIQVNVLEDDADKLMVRLQNEGENSPCDILMTADAGRLLKAEQYGLLQSIKNQTLENNIPAHLRDVDGHWFGLTMRARVIVFNPAKISPDSIHNYEDLADPKYHGKLLMRSSDNVYNQSLVASFIAHSGYDSALVWAKAVVQNFARDPKGGDKDQVLAIAAGEGDITIANTYYIGRMLESSNEEEVKAAKSVYILFPNQHNRGTHINISGAGITKNAPNKENAIKLLEYLTSDKIQARYAAGNAEYPVKTGVEIPAVLKNWGDFKKDSLSLSMFGKYQEDALRIFNESGWK